MRTKTVLLQMLLAAALALPAAGTAQAGGFPERDLVLSTSKREGGNGTDLVDGGMRLSTGNVFDEEGRGGFMRNCTRNRPDGIDWIGVEIEILGLEPRLRSLEANGTSDRN